MQDADDTPCDRYETAVDVEEGTEHLEARIAQLEVALDRLKARLDRFERTVRWWLMVQMVWSTAGIALMVYLTRGGR